MLTSELAEKRCLFFSEKYTTEFTFCRVPAISETLAVTTKLLNDLCSSLQSGPFWTTGLGNASGYGSHTVDYTYNNSGNRDTMTSSAIGSTSYEYDNQKRLIGLANHRNQNFNFEYDSANRIKKIITPVMESSMSFDSTNFLTSLIHTNNSGTLINSFEYVRDALGNRIQIRTPAGNFDYSYDQNSQLTNSQSPEVGVESFTYDPLGNRITDQNGNYIYDSKAQRLIEDYNYFYSFDDNGNLSSKVTKDLSKTENYIHDSQNRMVEFAVFEGSTKTREVKYFYDALGRRMRKVSNELQNATSQVTNFLYEGNEVIAKTDDSNQVLVSFTHSSLRTDDPLAMHITSAGVQAGIAQSPEDIFYAKDAQGSVIDLVDSNGELIEHYSYGSFGKLLKITDTNDVDVTDNSSIEPYFTYTAREFETESGLYYYRARYYDSSVGRFVQTDPEPGDLFSPSSFLSKYTYVGNSPVAYTDPFGLKRGIGNFLSNTWKNLSNGNFGEYFSSDEFALVVTTFVGAGLIYVGSVMSVANPQAGFIVGAFGTGILIGGVKGYKDDDKDKGVYKSAAQHGAIFAAGATGAVFGGWLATSAGATGLGAFGLTVGFAAIGGAVGAELSGEDPLYGAKIGAGIGGAYFFYPGNTNGYFKPPASGGGSGGTMNWKPVNTTGTY